ncbi:MAG: Lpg1974 family pore-forming outer membrane protein [Simkaniaceae bacterium]
MLKKLFTFFFVPFFIFAAEEVGVSCLPDECLFPSAGPRVCNGANYFITADYLYWTAREEGLSFATTGVKNNLPENPDEGRVYKPRFRYDSGFKFGLGASLPHDGWDLFAEYTWFHGGAGRQKVSTDRIFPTMQRLWFTGGDLSLFFLPREADGRFHLQFNVVDLSLGRNFFTSKYFSMRPHIGFKGTWQNQDLLIRYITIDNALIERNERIHVQQFFWGVGMRGGVDFTFHFNPYWAFFGRGSLSGLWGRFESERRDRQFENDLQQVMLDNVNDFHSLKPVLELMTGLRADLWFCDYQYHLGLEVGFEQQIWWSQGMFYRFIEGEAHGSLTLQGLTVKLRFDF